MIKRNKLFLIAIAAAGLILPTVASAIDLHIDVGDRGYYTRGANYWDGNWQYVWVPGHRYHGQWIHGHYRRGEHRRHRGSQNHHGDHHERYDGARH